jgi:hypothetical protein
MAIMRNSEPQEPHVSGKLSYMAFPPGRSALRSVTRRAVGVRKNCLHGANEGHGISIQRAPYIGFPFDTNVTPPNSICPFHR